MSIFHHGSLFTSFQLLFEKRLGHNLFRPIGTEWASEGYWEIAKPYGNDIRTITQYLGIRDEVKPGMGKMNDIEEEAEDYYTLKGSPLNHKALTLEQFKNMKIDVVIASIPEHIKPYQKLIDEFQPDAKLIFQMGNHFTDTDFNLVDNLMSSTSPFGVPLGINKIFYHQEFDLDVFNYEPPLREKTIRSFVHTLMTADHLKKDWIDFLLLEKALPGFKFESLGASCRDGCAMGEEEVAKLMKSSMFGVNFKTGGDGYGHVLFNWFAVGRPVIVKMSQYKDKLAGELMVDGKTCIDIEGLDVKDVIKKIEYFSDEERHGKMCINAHDKFKDMVDFDKEAKFVSKFLDNLI